VHPNWLEERFGGRREGRPRGNDPRASVFGRKCSKKKGNGGSIRKKIPREIHSVTGGRTERNTGGGQDGRYGKVKKGGKNASLRADEETVKVETPTASRAPLMRKEILLLNPSNHRRDVKVRIVPKGCQARGCLKEG